MLFGKRDKKTPNERVADLKARVDALRHADQAARGKPQSLDQFLEGDDVLTGREVEDNYLPSGSSPDRAPQHQDQYEAALAAELEKYIQREEERALKKEQAAPSSPEPPASLSTGESSSLLLDGTWSRDADRRPNLTAADRAWGATSPEGGLAGEETARGLPDSLYSTDPETGRRDGERAV